MQIQDMFEGFSLITKLLQAIATILVTIRELIPKNKRQRLRVCTCPGCCTKPRS